jgi:integrase
MARTKPKERARDRILADDELRDLWQATEAGGVFFAIVRLLLLTAQRRDEVSQMQWPEIDGNTWVIPADRSKTKVPNVVPLTDAAFTILSTLERRNEFVFAGKGSMPFNGFSKAKRALDKKIADLRDADGRNAIRPWVLHDLRRTARSLMSRAGVDANVAERVLNHVIPGVRGVYDRHSYEAEKRDALERLTMQLTRILQPQPDSVIPLRTVARG